MSPDGKWIACYYPKTTNDVSDGTNLSLTRISVETAAIVSQFDAVSRDDLSPIAWSDNQHFNHVTNEGGGSRLWRYSLNGDPSQMLLDSTDERVFRYVWSDDGKNVVYEKGRAINDIILLKSIEN